MRAGTTFGEKPRRHLDMCMKIIGEQQMHICLRNSATYEVLPIFRDQADWFMKADDDTYVIVENLRSMLESYNSSQPIYFGRKFKIQDVAQGFMSGGAGYVLSREALNRFVNIALADDAQQICKTKDHTGPEDVEIGKCLENVNVVAGDSRDSMGRGRFFPFIPEHHLIPDHETRNTREWWHDYIFYPSKEVKFKIS